MKLDIFLFDVGGVMHTHPGSDRLEHSKLNAKMYNLVAALKQMGIMCCAASNTCAEHVAILTRMGVYDCFDKVFFSHILGVRKPDREFFKSIMKKLRRKDGRRFVFIDDCHDNLRSPHALRMKTLWFQSQEHTIECIAELLKQMQLLELVPSEDLARKAFRQFQARRFACGVRAMTPAAKPAPVGI